MESGSSTNHRQSNREDCELPVGFSFTLMISRERLNSLLDRVKSIELILTSREEELERQKMETWKKEKVCYHS